MATGENETTPDAGIVGDADVRRGIRAALDPLLLVAAVVVVIVDQISKRWIVDTLGPTQNAGSIEVLGDYLKLIYTTNTGAAFGLFTGQTAILAAISILAVPILLAVRASLGDIGWLPRLTLGLLLGGALGNMIDRVFVGRVVDFIDAGIGNLRWFPFNVADSSFVVGVIVLIVYVLFAGDDKRQ